MRKEILEALKAKFTGVSDTILDRVAKKLADTVTNAEEVAAAVEGVTFQQVLESYGDSRATDAQKTAVANYEKKHNLKNGVKLEENGGGEKPQPQETKPKENEEQTKVAEEKTPAWAQVLIDDNKKLKEQIAAMQGEKTASTRRAALAKVLEGAPDKIKARFEKDFDRLNFKDDEDFNAWLGETTTDVKDLTSEFQSKGGVVSQPKGGNKGGNGNNAVDPLVTARIKAQETTNAAPAIAGLQSTTK